jgi:oxalate decarboxylase
MSKFQRRDFLAGAATFGAATAATLAATGRAQAGDPSFMNNVPDPILASKDLPTFKFELEKSQGRVIDGSYGKEATVEQLPISKGSPASQCVSSRAPCASSTGTPPRPSGLS